MRDLKLILIGCLLLAPFGCAKKDDAAADAKSPETAASKTPDEKTPVQQAGKNTNAANQQAGKNTEASNQQAANTPKTPTRQTNNPPKTPTPAPKASNLPSEYAAFGYIPQNAVLLVSVRPSSVLNNEMLKNLPADQFPIEQQLLQMQEKTGIDLKTIERVTFALWPGNGHATQFFGGSSASGTFDNVAPLDDASPGSPGGQRMMGPPMDSLVIVQFSQAVDQKALEEKIPGEEADASHNGITYRTMEQKGGEAYFMPDPKTLLLSHKDDMPEVLDNKTTAKAVESALKSGLDHDLAIVALLDSFRDQLQEPALIADEKLQGVADLPEQVDAALVYVDLKDGVDLQVVIDANTDEAPKTIKKAYDLGYGLLGGLIALQLPAMLTEQFGEKAGPDVLRLAQQVYTSAKGEPAGQQFKLSLHVPSSASEVFQTAFAAQQQRMQERMKAMHGRNNLKQIALALHNYHDAFGSFPFPSGRADAPQPEKGKLSWRVHILPFLEEDELYQQFKLDEPWDSEHNKALLGQMPEVYRLDTMGLKLAAGETTIVAPAGKGYVVDGDKPRRVRDFRDGTSNSIMALTVKPEKAEPWTKPGGFELDPAKASEVLGGDPNGFLALFADGSVHPLDANIDADALKALLTINGGENIDRSIIDKQGVDRFSPPGFEKPEPEIIRPTEPVKPADDIE